MTVEIPMNKGYVAVVDDEDADLALLRWTTREPPDGGGRGCVYAGRKFPSGGARKFRLMHRIILERMLGFRLTRYQQVDHIDGNGLINVRANLRLATPTQNAQNRRYSQSDRTGVRGVSWDTQTGKWRAHIVVNGKYIHIGRYADLSTAIEARHSVERRLFGEFSPLVSGQTNV